MQFATGEPSNGRHRYHVDDFLKIIGVPTMEPLTSVVESGCDPLTVQSHLLQSGHLIYQLKISNASWLVADEGATRRKIAAARGSRIPVVTSAGPFDIALAQGRVPAYLDLCAELGITRVECSADRLGSSGARQMVLLTAERGLELQCVVGHPGLSPSVSIQAQGLVAEAQRWRDAGARQIVIDPRTRSSTKGRINGMRTYDAELAGRFAQNLGLASVMYVAPDHLTQTSLMNDLGREVQLCDVRMSDLLLVESYRRGLDAEAFVNPRLQPPGARMDVEHAPEVRE